MRAPPHPLLVLAAVVFSGAIHAALAPPANWYAVQLLSWVPAFWALDRLEGRRLLLTGWLGGIAAQGAIFSWIVHTISTFSNLPLPVAVLVLGLFAAAFGFYVAVFAWGFPHVKRLAGPLWPLALAAWFCACEFLNPQLFPYFEGVVWYQVPRVFLVTATTGVAAVSFLVMLCNAVVYGLFDRWLRQRAGEEPIASRPLLIAAVTLLLGVLFALTASSLRLRDIERAELTAPRVRLAMVQSNRDVFARHDLMRKSKTALADDQVALMAQAFADDPAIDAFVLPEGALQGRPDWPRNFRVRKFVADSGVEIWTGGSSNEAGPDKRQLWFNSAFRIFGKGESDVRYDKNVLLPFGEFMPLAGSLPFLKRIQGVGNYQAGDGVVVFDALESVKFAYLICYEAILSRYVRKAVRAGANLLVNITYDAWFGDTACPHQHLMLSAMQSAQYGVPLVRSATTGISAFVDARGMLVKTAPVFTRQVLVHDVALVRRPGLYARFGDWFAWLCVVASVFVLTVLRVRRRPSGEPAPGRRALWPLGLFLVGAAVNGAIVLFGWGPIG